MQRMNDRRKLIHDLVLYVRQCVGGIIMKNEGMENCECKDEDDGGTEMRSGLVIGEVGMYESTFC